MTGTASDALKTDILIIGAGPCGVMIAHYLGLYGVKAILADRSEEILDYPRAVGLDDETIRGFQAIGMAERLLADMVLNAPLRYHDDKGRYLAHVRPEAQPFGWARRATFLQPRLETDLRDELTRRGSVDLKWGWELQDFSQKDSHVDAVFIVDGEEKHIQCRYLVGADGGRSTVRKLAGIELAGKTQDWRWLVIDTYEDSLYAPYSATYLDTRRPKISIDLPYNRRRFEFRLLKDESEEEMTHPERMRELIQPFYENGRPLPKIQRGRVYRHHSRCAVTFQNDRVFLAGDAAHLQPPFFGQGMNSGQRDAANISWKLAAVIKGLAGPEILESYDTERRDHAKAMVRLATWIGVIYAPSNRWSALLRRVLLKGIRYFSPAQNYVLQMKFKPMAKYDRGIVVRRESCKGAGVGMMFMQPDLETSEHQRIKLDTAMGDWFAVIGINTDPADHLSEEALARWKQLGARFLQINKSRMLSTFEKTKTATIKFDDVDGSFRDWLTERPSAEILVIRPDRYLLSACRGDEFEKVTEDVMNVLCTDPVGQGLASRPTATITKFERKEAVNV